MNGSPLILVDSYAMIYRGYYAVRALTTSSGAPSNAIFAFSKFIARLQKDYPPESGGAFVFDLGRPAHRLTLAPQYKANRPPMPEDLRAQLPAIRELIAAFGWPIIEAEGYEADDLIASIAIELKDRKALIVSGDKDLSQLVVEGRVEMLVPDKDGGLAKRGVKEVTEKFGVPPELIPDLLALTGDSSDNIPGVEGVGPKTAAALVSEFGSLASVMARSGEIKRDALRAKIQAASGFLETNLRLVKLGLDKPEGMVWTDDKFKRKEPDAEKLRSLAKAFELKSLLKELDAQAAPPEPQKPVQMDLF